jgi:hypothetical protein
MTFGHAFEDAPSVWGVGRLVIDGIVTPWPVAQADIDDEAESLAPRLSALGLEPGGLVLIASMLSEAIHVVPLEKAAGKVGALYSSADATPFDAFRVASLVRQLEAQVVMGVNGAVLDGLEDAAAVFGGLRSVVTADDDAHGRLTAAGLEPRRWVKLGPTSAIEGTDGDGLRYDETRWQVEADGQTSELLLTNLAPRLTPCDRFPTGLRGAVLEPGLLAVRADPQID